MKEEIIYMMKELKKDINLESLGTCSISGKMRAFGRHEPTKNEA
jgi:hypothetical protein